MKVLLRHSRLLALSLVLVILGVGVVVHQTTQRQTERSRFVQTLSKLKAQKPPKLKRKAARDDHFFNMLRDPRSNRIPDQVRARELAFARTLPLSAGKTANARFEWTESGPYNIGGRTRALAVDVTDPNTLITGGVTGGIFKSTDGGHSWTKKTDRTETLSVTSVAQDPRPGHTHVWYHTAGETRGTGGSPTDPESASGGLLGGGFYKSVDAGETWVRILSAGDVPQLDNPFDQASRVVVHPENGDVYVASNHFGILRSRDGGQNFTLILGGAGHHVWSDVTITADGRVLAAVSDGSVADETTCASGIYLLEDPETDPIDGCNTFTSVSTENFPFYHERSVLAAAPSNPDVAYAYTYEGCTYNEDDGTCPEDIGFYKLDLSTGSVEDRSMNLPNFVWESMSEGEVTFTPNTQGAYNMALAVKPDDEDFVLLGGINLIRSADGFATPIDSDELANDFLLGGGLLNDPITFPGHHTDLHVLVFDPQDPNRVWNGHDGGVSVLADVTFEQDLETAIERMVEGENPAGFIAPWELRNNGYNVTQFYTIIIDDEAGDTRIMGGTQDNGTPFFTLAHIDEGLPNPDVSLGDGSFGYFGEDFAYVSTQNGSVFRVPYLEDGRTLTDANIFSLLQGEGAAYIVPEDAANQLFINPFVVDPNDEDVMYYPAGADLWRHDALSEIPDDAGMTGDPAQGWMLLEALTLPDGYAYSALTATREAPAHRLYLGAFSHSDQPRFYRLDDAVTGVEPVDISIPDAPTGAWVNNIAVNPENGDEVIAVMSNYGIVGVYHSLDGGDSWTAIEGNLQGGAQNHGPSIRAASILPLETGTHYLLGTSVGLFSATELNGMDTEWGLEGPETMGNVIVEALASRPSDGLVAMGTHGRGAFYGQIRTNTAVEGEEVPFRFSVEQNYPNPFNPSTTLAFTLSEPGRVSVSVFDVNGRRVRELLSGAHKSAGRHTLAFDAGHLASGTYLYQVRAQPVGGKSAIERSGTMTLLK